MAALRRLVASLPLLLLGASPVSGQWASLGDMSAPRREGASLVYANRQGTVAVTPISAEVVRVRFAPLPRFGRDHSYAVVSRDLGPSGATYQVSATTASIKTPALTVTIRHRPFRIAFADAGGASLDEDDPAQGIHLSGSTVRVAKRLREDDQVFGLGEKAGRLNKRGKQLGGYSYAMWNTDAYGYDAGIDPLYASFPFFIVMRQGRAHGIFLDNTHRSHFDIGKQSQGLLAFGAEGGELDYYFIDGPDPKQVVARYAQLTGRMPLPPLWSLGLHQCRYSYFPDSRVRFIADNFRERRIPADTLWLDIHYLDGYNPFTWDAARFPDPAGLVRDLKDRGFRLVPIVDPHPAKRPGWDVYDTGLAGDHFVKRPDGTVYEAPVWPSNAERNPAPSVFPDFSKPAARQWWGGLYKRLTDIGIAGIWNDMNEPAVFVGPTWTFPTDLRHDNEGQATDHREIHNVYGMLMTKSTYEGLLALRPDERPFVLTRASFSGGQRYSALWPGDNSATWADLRMSLPMLMSLGLSGMPFVGSDIGGFAGSPSAELFTRWLQAGVFYPFMRIHSAFGTEDQEPWSYGVVHEAANRRAIELRYEMLPQLYNEMQKTSVTGVPAYRPLFLEFPADPSTWEMDDQVMLGSDLLVAPVIGEGQQEREVYLPEGAWYDLFSGRRFDGGTRIKVPVTLASIPTFAREGAFVFRQPAVQHTGDMPGQPLRVHVYPTAESSRSLYEDAGNGFRYQQGESLSRRFRQVREPNAVGGQRVTIDVSPAEGRYRPAPRSLELHVHGLDLPATVTVSLGAREQVLPRLDPGVATAASGWMRSAEGVVVVKHPDVYDGLRVTLSR